MTVGLSVATMYGNVQNVVWLPWQPFKSRTLISWGLFVILAGIPNYWCITICVGNLTIIGSDKALSPGRRQAIIWTNAGMLSIGPLGTNFSDILLEILTFLFRKMRLKASSQVCEMAAIFSRPQCVNTWWISPMINICSIRSHYVKETKSTLIHVKIYIHLSRCLKKYPKSCTVIPMEIPSIWQLFVS